MTKDIVGAGGVGVVSVASHLAGPQVRGMVEAIIAGDDAEADRLDTLLAPLFDSLFLEPNPMPLKGGLNALWDDVGQPRLPLVSATTQTVKLVEEAMAAVVEA
jgi:4-hydroxy-tetrahydrodipicolinate synthase